MYVTGTGGITGTQESLMYEMDNVGILPFPQGPNATPGIYPSYYEQITYATCIPVNASDAGAAALIIDSMYEPFEGLETKDDIASYMAEQIFFDIRDAEVFIHSVAHTEYGFFWEGGRSVIESAVSTDTPISSLLESNRGKYDELVEEFLVPHYEGRISVYGE